MARRKAKRYLYYHGGNISTAELERLIEEFVGQREIALRGANRIFVGADTSTGIDFTSVYGRIAATSSVVVDPSRIFVLTPDSTL